MNIAAEVDRGKLAELCRRYHVRQLSVFGSAVRNELRPESDIDFLIEFAPESRPGMVEFYQLEQELSALYGGRRVDLVNPRYLNHRIRERVLAEAELQFAEG
jgi:predicted nucleotidyltransferase